MSSVHYMSLVLSLVFVANEMFLLYFLTYVESLFDFRKYVLDVVRLVPSLFCVNYKLFDLSSQMKRLSMKMTSQRYK